MPNYDNLAGIKSEPAIPVSKTRASNAQGSLKYLGDKNGTQIITYPSDLSTNPQFNGDKVVFFINVSNDSKAVSGNTYTKGKYQAALLEIPEGDIIKKSGDAAKNILQETGKLLNSVGLGKLNTTSNIQKRLSVAIALHMPNNVAVGNSVIWNSDDGDSNLLEVLNATIKGYKEDGIAGAASNAVSATKENIAAKMLRDSNTWQRATRITPGNTKQEMKFDGVNFRSFSFQYTFIPKNAAEAADILEIIRMFKYHMLPEFKGENNFLFTYPSEFQIKYYRGNQENTFIDKYMTAVCNRVNVNYTADGQYNTFANGMPTRINLELDFTELGFATKETASIGSFHGV